MPALSKCHYDVLAVQRNASDEDIKKAFRKLALVQHPDKNPDRLEEAKEEFQRLQQAYEVLSNPQERAWYDEHRHAILRGDADGEFDEDIIDILPFCSSSCYKGFGDDDEGFYTVYRKLFEKIAAEEYETGLEPDSDEEIPNFGDSQSTYEDCVGPFYAYWEAYCTHQNFGWVDEYDTRHAGNRRVARLMDKENKKFRTKAKQLWNQKVRALVDFVKRKDKRVQAWKTEQEKILKEKEEAARRKQAEEKAIRIRERQKIFQQLQSSKENHAKENQDQLQQLESWMADEFQDGNEVLEDEDEELEYCHPCQKSFRTKQALINHEKSKKHLQQLQRWAEENNISDGDSEENIDDYEKQESCDEQEVHKENAKDEAVDKNLVTIDNHSSKDTERISQNGVKIENENANKKSDDHESDIGETVDELSARFMTNIKFKEEAFQDPHQDEYQTNRVNLKGSKRVKSKQQQTCPQTGEFDRVGTTFSAKCKTNSDTILQHKPLHDDDDDEDNFFGMDRKKSKHKKPRRANKSNVNSSEVSTSSSCPTGNGTESQEDVVMQVAATVQTKPYACGQCGEGFDSRSKLFKHLSITGHALEKKLGKQKKIRKKIKNLEKS